MKLKELEYKDLVELIDFIEDHFKDQADSKTKTLMVLRKFIPDLDGFQLITFMNFLENKSTEGFESLIKSAGEVTFDPTGKSEPKESDFLKMNFDMIENMAENPLKDDAKTSVKRRYREIRAAKTLEPLLNIKVSNIYTQKKKLYLRKLSKFISVDTLNKIEGLLKEDNELKHSVILERVLEYISSRSEDNAKIFFEHFSIRVESCLLDKELSDPRNREFYEKLKKISS